MKKSKIQISVNVLDAITGSRVISENEKLSFLKYIGYMTYDEQKEFLTLI